MANPNIAPNPFVGFPLSTLVRELASARSQKSQLEKREKLVLEALKPVADPTFDLKPNEAITFDGIQLMRVPGTNSTISAQKLLDRGVAPDIIDSATSRVSYFQYRTMELKNGR